MRRSYESPLPLQEGWSSLQTHSRTRRDTHRGLARVSGRLGNLHARTSLRVCSKNLQIAPNCGSWASSVTDSSATEPGLRHGFIPGWMLLVRFGITVRLRPVEEARNSTGRNL